MPTVLTFKHRHPPPAPHREVHPSSARSVHQAPVLKLSYVDESGRTQHASIYSSSNLAQLADDEPALAQFIEGVSLSLAALDARLTSFRLVSSACIEIEGADDAV